MANLVVDPKNLKDLFQKRVTFLIPDYQRPYTWEGDKECQTLWDDIYDFSFPDNDYTAFKYGEEYYLGPIVTFKNSDGKIEIIDGQQRLTTILLLLRVLYKRSAKMEDKDSKDIAQNLEKCIWQTNQFGGIDRNSLKIESEVITDDARDELIAILQTGEAPKEFKSKYAENYRFFEEKVAEFSGKTPTYFPHLPAHILNDCVLLPIEADSQNTALRIFSTLNDRGKPLSDSDIFKAQFYKFYGDKGKKDIFIDDWKKLVSKANEIFKTNAPMDELFTRYMYYERAKKGNDSSTTEALRSFYGKDKFEVLHSEDTFNNLKLLANFWEDIFNQNKNKFSEETLKLLFVLNFAPNGMWANFVSVYFMQNKDSQGLLEEAKFNTFLNRTIAFVWAYAFTNPGVNALRTPIYKEMINIIDNKEVTFEAYKFEEQTIRTIFETTEFKNGRPITKSMIAWWAMHNSNQPLLSLQKSFDIEHIYPKKQYELHKKLSSEKVLESIGNKALLEKEINIRAAEYRFIDRIKYYRGYGDKEGTKNQELLDLTNTKQDWVEEDINNRYNQIIDGFIQYLKENNLLK